LNITHQKFIEAVNKVEGELINGFLREENQINYSHYRNILLSEWHTTSDKNFKTYFPAIINEYSSLDAFWVFMRNKFSSYEKIKIYIYENFIPFRQYLESKVYKNSQIVDFVPNIILSSQNIREDIDKANERIKDADFAGAITIARTLAEAILVEIYKKLNPGNEPEHKGGLLKLYKLVASRLSLSISKDKDLDERLKGILSGLCSITNGIADLRNSAGDAHAKKFKPIAHHARLAVNCAFTFAQFLCDTYLYQK
jgi:hypothetical protein